MATIRSAVGDGPSVVPTKLPYDGSGSVQVADPETLFLGDYSRLGHDLLIEHNGTSFLVQDYFAGPGANLAGPNGAFLTPAVVEALAGPAAPGQYAQAGTTPAAPAAASLVEIGKVVSVEGDATATHADGVTVNLANGDPVYQGDVVRTGPGSKLGVSFIDDSVFSMSADARMVLDELVFDPAKAADSSMVVNLVQGSFVFVTGQVAPAGNMKVETPVATMGIRGTTPKVLIDTNLGVTEFTILPDPGSGKIGSYLLLDKTTGEILGTVETSGDKWVITSLSGEAVKIAKSGLDLLEDERALTDIRDAVSNALGTRTEYNGSNSFQQVAFDSSASAGQGDGSGGPNDGGGPGGGNGGVIDPSPDKDDPPVAGDDTFTIDEDHLLLGKNVINASGGGADGDPEGFAVTVTQVNGETLDFLGGTASEPLPSGALLLIGQTGGITYDPTSAFNYLAAGESATDTFAYTIKDQFGYTDTATVQITVQGRNDTPVITVVDVDGTIDDIAEDNPQGNISITETGSITFADVDLSDRPVASETTLSISWIGQSGQPSPPELTPAQKALIENAFTITNVAGNDNDGTVTWKYTIDENAIDFLGAGEKVIVVFRITVDDGYVGGDPHPGIATQDVTITINGATASADNDEPVISVVTGDGDSGAIGLAETNAPLATSGTLTVSEVDLTDEIDLQVVSVVASGTGPSSGRPDDPTLLDMLSVPQTPILQDVTSTGEQFTWTFNSDGQAFDYLAQGETLVLTYLVRATDDQNASDTQTMVVTITGTNDAPVISLETGDGASALLAETNAGLTIFDTLTVTELDRTDSITTSVVEVAASGTGPLAGQPAGLLGMLSLSASPILTDMASTSAQFTWTFNSGSEAFNYLNDGETLVLTYKVRATDGTANADQDVVVTITGTNDAPVISLETGDGASALLAETNAGLTIFDTLTVTELDRTDSITTSVVEVAASGTGPLAGQPAGLLGMLSLSASPILTDTASTSAQFTWTFNSGSEAFNYLNDGETLILTYKVRATDGTANADQTVVVTITGTNDAPVISLETGDGASALLAETNAGLTIFDTLTVTELDRTDSITTSVVEVAASGTGPLAGQPAGLLGMLSLSASPILTDTASTSAQFTWTFNSGSEAFNYLNDGETLILTYTVRATDGTANADQDVVVTITGTNDAPVVSAGAALDYFRDDGAKIIDAALTVGDVDDANLVGATVSLGSTFVAGEDVLGFVDQGGITGSFNPVNGVLTLNGVASKAAYQAALQSVTYTNTSDTPDTDPRQVSFVVNDGDADSVAGVSTVNVSPVSNIVGTNDPETLTGDEYADRISGLDGDDELFGLAGNDTLDGGGGWDFLDGGLNDDQLFGGEGDDTLVGGDGADEFVFLAGDISVDEILDFETNNDSISLYGYDESTTVISLEDNGAGGSYLRVNGVDVASLADVSYETELTIDYTDHHVITMMALV